VNFLKRYQEKKAEVSKLYIEASLFLKSYADVNKISISEVASAFKFIGLADSIPTYSFDNQLNQTINDKSVLNDILDEVINYGTLYKGSIKETTYKRFKNVKIKLSDLDEVDEVQYPPQPINLTTEDQKITTESQLSIDKLNETIKIFKADFEKSSLYNSPYLSPFEACCLMSGKSVSELSEKFGAYDICQEWEFLSAKNYIRENLKSGRLYLTDECLGIPSLLLKTVMFEDGRIIQGFNDDILLEVFNESTNPEIVFKVTDEMFGSDNTSIKFTIPDDLKDNIMQSYPMRLERKIKDLENQIRHNEEDSLNSKGYALISILKNLLLDSAITSNYFCNSDSDTAKKKPIQGELSRHIADMKIQGLSKRNVDDLFATANDVLEEVIKSNEK